MPKNSGSSLCVLSWLSRSSPVLPVQTERFLAAAQLGQATLTLGLPTDWAVKCDGAIHEQLHRCLVFVSGPIPPSLSAVASSRISKQWDRQQYWFECLRTAMIRMRDNGETLLTAEGTTTHRYAVRAADLFGIPVVRISCVTPSRRQTSRTWLKSLVRLAEEIFNNSSIQVLVSPPLDGVVHSGLPLADQLVATLADRYVALDVRKGGHVHAVIQRRMHADPANGKTFVVLPDSLEAKVKPASVHHDLLAQGAVGWHLRRDPATVTPIVVADKWPSQIETPPVLSVKDVQDEPWEFLGHWTRANPQAWPDQTEQERIDELLLSQDRNGRSVLATLIRILRRELLQASSRTIRSESGVVCFTEVPPWEWPGRRTFRPHLSRWDFEPYGIAIRKQRVKQLGGRPVIYGDEAKWQTLEPEDHFRFQKLVDDTDGIDWTSEREWRIPHDVDLRLLADDAAVVIVPNQEVARQLTSISRWPMLVLDE
ncbi:MAG: hypothetical protein KDA87_05630 [Planctomycetales bacterium]|nr:hypothetical protein [Planctomycetales bacterium]